MESLSKLISSGVKVEIHGQFLRNVEGVENDLKGLSYDAGDYSHEEREQGRVAIERDRKPYDFLIRVFSLDMESGLFVAEGNDYFGKSGIVGLMGKPQGEYGGTITFSKNYVRGKNSFSGGGGEGDERNFRDNLRQIFYSGSHFLTPKNVFGASGKYSCQGLNYKMMGGTWEMSTQLK